MIVRNLVERQELIWLLNRFMNYSDAKHMDITTNYIIILLKIKIETRIRTSRQIQQKIFNDIPMSKYYDSSLINREIILCRPLVLSKKNKSALTLYTYY